MADDDAFEKLYVKQDKHPDRWVLYVVIGMVIIVLAAAFGVGYFAANEGPADESEEDPVPSDWRSFGRYGVSFAYPPSWEVSEKWITDERFLVNVKGENAELAVEMHWGRTRSGGYVVDDPDAYTRIETRDGRSMMRRKYEMLSEVTHPSSAQGEDRYAFGYHILSGTSTEQNAHTTAKWGIADGGVYIDIEGGVEKAMPAEAPEGVAMLDRIVSTFSFDGMSGELRASDLHARTYTNEAYGFSLEYPEGYGAFSRASTTREGRVFAAEANSVERVLTGNGYQAYPDLRIEIAPVEEYAFDTVYAGIVRYDPDEEVCYRIMRDDQRRRRSFVLHGDGWRACKVAFGDAGYAYTGYMIPHGEWIIEIAAERSRGQYRPLDIEAVVEDGFTQAAYPSREENDTRP